MGTLEPTLRFLIKNLSPKACCRVAIDETIEQKTRPYSILNHTLPTDSPLRVR